MADLLIELGCEEIPAGFLDRGIREFGRLVEGGLKELGLAPSEVRVGATPRRLAVWAGGIPERQDDVVEERTGPSEKAAYKDGVPQVPAIKFAESLGLAVEDLEVVEVKKGKKVERKLFGKRTVEGRGTREVLVEELPKWIEAIPFKKSMRWVTGSKLRFARPLRSLVVLLGGEVVPVEWNGVVAGRGVQGHRFLHPEVVELEGASWEGYVSALEERHVVLDGGERRRRIVEALKEELTEGELEARRGLVAEVTNLVEWPQVDVGEFEERFLELPAEVVREAMVDHQRYFPVEGEGGLAPRFAYVANRPFDAVIRAGNERVLRARLQDALFFYELDLKTPLEERVGALSEIVFMPGLGSYEERVPRIEGLMCAVAEQLGEVSEELRGKLRLAARLARADLTTEVVQEFPSLQGRMGTIYARVQGVDEEVAGAIEEGYLPRGEGDGVAETKVGACLALADKLDTIASAFATGRGPTGSKDPFAVRRAVLGVLRTLRGLGWRVAYRPLVELACGQMPKGLTVGGEELVEGVLGYMRDRLEVMATKDEGVPHDIARAALNAGWEPTNVVDYWARVEALQELAADERFRPLCELVERTRNITQKNGPEVDPGDVDASRLEEPAEKALVEALEGCRAEVESAVDEGRYAEAGRTYTEALAKVVHTFFEPAPVGVFVMHEDERLRTNRLALLKQVHQMLARGFADLAEVKGA